MGRRFWLTTTKRTRDVFYWESSVKNISSGSTSQSMVMVKFNQSTFDEIGVDVE